MAMPLTEKTESKKQGAPYAKSFPISVVLEYLHKVTKEDAQEYALGYVNSTMRSNKLFYGVFPFGEGFIVEMHEGGAGKAFSPSLFAAIDEAITQGRDLEKTPLKVVVRSGKEQHLYLSLTSTTLTALSLPKGLHIDSDITAAPSESSLIKAKVSHGVRLMSVTGGLVGISFIAFLVASFNSAQMPSISIDQVAASQTASAWLSKKSWGDSEIPHTLKYLDGKWVAESYKAAPPKEELRAVQLPVYPFPQ